MESFDKIIIGASIRHGKHNPTLYEFIQKHQKLLTQKVSGFFSVSLVARKPEKIRLRLILICRLFKQNDLETSVIASVWW